MSEQVPAEEKLIQVQGFGPGYVTTVSLSIDVDGDLSIDDDVGTFILFIRKEELPDLRDWLNKVLP